MGHSGWIAAKCLPVGGAQLCATKRNQYVSTTPKKLWSSQPFLISLELLGRLAIPPDLKTYLSCMVHQCNPVMTWRCFCAERLNCALRSAETSTEFSHWRTGWNVGWMIGWLVCQKSIYVEHPLSDSGKPSGKHVFLGIQKRPGLHWRCWAFRGRLNFWERERCGFEKKQFWLGNEPYQIMILGLICCAQICVAGGAAYLQMSLRAPLRAAVSVVRQGFVWRLHILLD